MQPGIYTDLSNEQYHAGPGYSKSQLDLVAKAPALLEWSKRAANDNSSKAASVGTALHMLILEPEAFAASYITEPGKFDLRTTAGKAARAEFEAEAKGRIVLAFDEWEMLQRQRDSVFAHPEARALIEIPGGRFETSAYWADPETGLLCRCRPDWWPMPEVIVDLKTTEDPSPHAFSRSIFEYRYHVQDAFYTDGAGAANGAGVEDFVFLAVGKKREMGRYPVRVYRLNEEDKQYGRELYRANLKTVLDCTETGEWPGIEEIRLPSYAYSR